MMKNYGTFLNRVQTLADLKYTWEAVITVRSTLSALQTIVFKGEDGRLASTLPEDIQGTLSIASVPRYRIKLIYQLSI